MVDLLVFGEVLADIYCIADGKPRPMDHLGQLERHLGGAPANFAVNCSRLGLSTALISRVGNDAMGRVLLRLLRDEGIDTTHVGQSPNKTGVSFVSVHDSGEREFDFYGAPSADLLIDEVPAVDARIIHFGSNTLILEPGISATRKAVDRDATISCDLNVRRYRWSDEAHMRAQLRWACGNADWLKVSDDELPFITQHTDERAAAELLDMGPSVVAITRGPGGASLYTRTQARHHPTLARHIVDTTGAGDAFWAGCVASLSRSDSLDAALRLGSEQAATCIARVGAT